MSRWSPLVGRALVACLTSAPGRTPPELEAVVEAELTAELVDAATHHRVVGYVDSHLAGTACPVEVVADVWARREMAARRHALVVEELAAVSEVLSSHQIELIVMKGPVLAERYYGSTSQRMYRDLDVLVRPGDFAAAVHALENAGYGLLDRNWALARDLMAAQLHLARPQRPVVDLHWHVVFDEGLRRVFRLPTADLFRRARAYERGDPGPLAFDDVDMLLHVCLHACLEGAGRLVWLLDVERIIAGALLDWDDFVGRARGARLHLVAATMLANAAGVLSAAVADGVLDALAPAGWLRAVRAAQRHFPASTSRGDGDPATLLARSARATVRGTLLTAAGRAVRRGRLVAATRTTALAPVPGEAHVMFRPAGGDQARRAYFASLAGRA